MCRTSYFPEEEGLVGRYLVMASIVSGHVDLVDRKYFYIFMYVPPASPVVSHGPSLLSYQYDGDFNGGE